MDRRRRLLPPHQRQSRNPTDLESGGQAGLDLGLARLFGGAHAVGLECARCEDVPGGGAAQMVVADIDQLCRTPEPAQLILRPLLTICHIDGIPDFSAGPRRLKPALEINCR